jgi:hypothetical protein
MKAAERSSQLEPYQLQIDNWLRTSPHITASRIGALLREQYGGLVIRERALRYVVANRRKALIPREAFIRAVYTPGAQAQFDFTPVTVNLSGVLVVLQLFVMRLSYSGPAFRAGIMALRPTCAICRHARSTHCFRRSAEKRRLR